MSKLSQANQDLQNLTFTALQSVRATLANESQALQNLASQYDNNVDSQLDLISSVRILYETISKGGKIVTCGIGKSYKIATKTVATLKSLSLNADCLHPTEALHGDLGLLRNNDCMIFFTASGNTPELLQLLPHISPTIPIVLLTCSKTSKLATQPQVKAILHTELPDRLKETNIHGIPAPTVTATLALALSDAVVLAVAEMVERDHFKRKKTFSMKHPGGSIGSDLSHLNENFSRMDQSQSMNILMSNQDSFSSLLSLDQLRKCFRSNSVANSMVSSPNTSESEEIFPGKADVPLSVEISNSNKSQLLKTDLNTISMWSELDLLQNMTLYEYLIYEADLKLYALDSFRAKSLYKLYKSSNEWLGMDGILKGFRIIEFEPSYFYK